MSVIDPLYKQIAIPAIFSQEITETEINNQDDFYDFKTINCIDENNKCCFLVNKDGYKTSMLKGKTWFKNYDKINKDSEQNKDDKLQEWIKLYKRNNSDYVKCAELLRNNIKYP